MSTSFNFSPLIVSERISTDTFLIYFLHHCRSVYRANINSKSKSKSKSKVSTSKLKTKKKPTAKKSKTIEKRKDEISSDLGSEVRTFILATSCPLNLNADY